MSSDKHFVKHLPENVQLKILSLIAGEASTAPHPSPARANAPPLAMSQGAPAATATQPDSGHGEDYRGWTCGLAARLHAHGFAWQDNMLPEEAARSLLQEAQALPADTLKPAGMSTSVAKWHDQTVRGDAIGWVPLEPTSSAFASLHATPAWARYRSMLAQVVEVLNCASRRAHGTGAEELRVPDKVMLAHYPAGARYVRHSDVSPAVSHRRVTSILYLNADWEPSHGGELLLHAPESLPLPVAPQQGRLLLFRSQLEHEVCMTHRPRWALTAWLSVAKAPKPAPADAGLAAILQLAATATTSAAAPAKPPPPAAPSPLALASALAMATATPTTSAPPLTAVPADGDEAARSATHSASTMARAPTIFVSVASYRDPEAPHTLRDLFEKAAIPERIHVGMCFQCASGAEDVDCIDLSALRAEWRDKVRSMWMPWKAARGPVWARFLIQRRLFAGEDYFLQIDSHTRFTPRWDEELIAMLSRCASPKPVLTTYPLPYEGDGADARLSEEQRLTVLCTRPAADAFGADGMLRFRARLLSTQPSAPLPTPFWAAGFSFSEGALVREVPYDPHLPFLFFGEEISIALRMWSRGYDLFAPDRHLVYHRWARCYRTTFWEVDGGAALKRASQARVRSLLTGRPLANPPSNPPYDSPPAGPCDAPAPSFIASPFATKSEYEAHLQLPAADQAMARHAAEARRVEAVAVAAIVEAAAGANALADDVASAPAPDEAIWALGSVRSLAAYEDFSGVDFTAMRVGAQAERGGMPSDGCFWDRFACLHAMLEAATPNGSGANADDARAA